MSALSLCVLSSEILPYAKTGGLADVAGALVRNLRLLGHEVHRDGVRAERVEDE